MTLSITISNGKYTVQQDDSGRVTALCYGEPWRDCVGDGLVLALAQEIEALRDALTKARDPRPSQAWQAEIVDAALGR